MPIFRFGERIWELGFLNWQIPKGCPKIARDGSHGEEKIGGVY